MSMMMMMMMMMMMQGFYDDVDRGEIMMTMMIMMAMMMTEGYAKGRHIIIITVVSVSNCAFSSFRSKSFEIRCTSYSFAAISPRNAEDSSLNSRPLRLRVDAPPPVLVLFPPSKVAAAAWLVPPDELLWW